ncbi:AAEL000957-PA [Aedes aegypti]|uniref:AAEL000957-PA n=1 Tax=Aedes aegypti TaxID=7159 RepID=Q17MP4_AEDAE|nr:AAEL000957-PA [Aedes aegypti]
MAMASAMIEVENLMKIAVIFCGLLAGFSELLSNFPITSLHNEATTVTPKKNWEENSAFRLFSCFDVDDAVNLQWFTAAGIGIGHKTQSRSGIHTTADLLRWIWSGIIGAGLFAFTIYIRAEPGFDEWVALLDIYQYYIGVYILIGTGALVMIFSFLGCCSALMEHSAALYAVSIKFVALRSKV